MILSLEKVSFKYVTRPILDEVDFVVNEKEKWGVVGLNGSGKSTLLKIMAEKEKPDSGNVNILRKYKISYCPQMMDFEPGLSVYDTVLSHLKEKTEVFQIKSILTKLGINNFEEKIDLLSGGQKKRVALAIALIKEADLYLLDEPTNHLDQDMILWLEKFLSHMNKALVLVTHDRYFLSRITNHIVDVENGHLYQYDGNYADYLEQREVRAAQRRSIEQKRQNFLRTEIEWIRRGAQARTSKSRARLEHFAKIAAIEAPQEKAKLELKSASTRLGGKTIDIYNLGKSYDKPLFKGFNYALNRNDRIGIIGNNGCGKSTLLKIILGEVKADEGYVEIGETVKIGYFAQHNTVMDDNKRVIDYIKDFGEVVYTADKEEITASQMLEKFLFSKDDQYNLIGKCSGGEKRRLYLCSILMMAPNILLLDEPTNDLDIDTLTILEDYLDNFKGAVISVSHDRYFLDKTCDRLWVFEDHNIQVRNEDYSTYLENRVKKQEVKQPVIKQPQTVKKNRLSYMEKRELEALDEKLIQLEEEISTLESKLNDLTDYNKILVISNELESKRNELETSTERWMELSEKEG